MVKEGKMNDNHLTESREDWEKRVFTIYRRHRAKEDNADTDKDVDIDKENNKH